MATSGGFRLIFWFCMCDVWQPVMSVKRVDVRLSSDSEDEQAGMKTATAAAGALHGAGDGKSVGGGKRQQTASPVKTQ